MIEHRTMRIFKSKAPTLGVALTEVKLRLLKEGITHEKYQVPSFIESKKAWTIKVDIQHIE